MPPYLKHCSVLLIGCGNMGSAIALALDGVMENLALTVIESDVGKARHRKSTNS